MHESTSHYFLCGLTSKRDDKIPFGMESLMEEFLAHDASVECWATGGASIRVGTLNRFCYRIKFSFLA